MEYSAEEVRGRPVWTLLADPNLRYDLEQLFGDPRQLETPFKQEGPWVTKSGVVRRLRWCFALADPTRPDTSPVIAAGIDATDMKRVFAKLQQSERQYQAIFETTGTATIIIEEDTTIALANSEFERLSGFSKTELEGRMSWTELMSPEDLPKMLAYHRLRRVDPEAAPRRYECRLVNRKGEARDTFLTIDMIPGTKQSVGSFQDITDYKRTQEQARQQLAQLAHVSRLSMAGEMASGLAHELNQPLFAIVNFAEGCIDHLRSGCERTDEVLAALDDIAKEAERAGQIVHRLRDFVSRREPRFEDKDLNAVVRQAAAFLEADARHAGVSVRMDLAEGPLTTCMDAVQIQQVVLNLLKNSFEAVAHSNCGDRQLAVRTWAEDGQVEFAVVDGGLGLNGAALDQVFEPFFTTKPEGMGMGLSISRTIIEAHRGHLWARPNAERGMTFGFTLRREKG